MKNNHASSFLITIIFFFSILKAESQELFVSAEPASNMPAHSIGGEITGKFIGGNISSMGSAQRFLPEIMFGISKRMMLHLFSSFSNMYSSNLKFESLSVYVKYRIFSNDDIHKHFRIAIFAEASHTNNSFLFDEINLRGDKSGVQFGIIATQLWNKFALSTTISNVQLLGKERFDKVYYIPPHSYQSFDYSLSAGYLLFPKEYDNYRQLNVNIYAELLGQQAYEYGKGYLDLAPAVQFIFNSNAKLNIGYRFQLNGNMTRMSKNSWAVSFERTFFNALHSKNK